MSYLLNLNTFQVNITKFHICLVLFSLFFSSIPTVTIHDFRYNKKIDSELTELENLCKSTDCVKRLIEYQTKLFEYKLSDINSPNKELYGTINQLIKNRLTYEFKL